MVILADHFEVPSSTLCLMVFICWAWMALVMANTSRISSKISGLFLSLIFILSFMAIMIFWVRSSAPCLELFSAAPEKVEHRVQWTYRHHSEVYSCYRLNAELTLQTVSVQQFLALLMALDATLWAPHALAGNSPQQSLTFITVRWRCGCPYFKVVRSCAGYWVDKSL